MTPVLRSFKRKTGNDRTIKDQFKNEKKEDNNRANLCKRGKLKSRPQDKGKNLFFCRLIKSEMVC
jgi:hypothetical protein